MGNQSDVSNASQGSDRSDTFDGYNTLSSSTSSMMSSHTDGSTALAPHKDDEEAHPTFSPSEASVNLTDTSNSSDSQEEQELHRSK